MNNGKKQRTNGKTPKEETVRITVDLFGSAASNFQLFKSNSGLRTDAEAGRQLMTQRLVQLRKRGALAA